MKIADIQHELLRRQINGINDELDDIRRMSTRELESRLKELELEENTKKGGR